MGAPSEYYVDPNGGSDSTGDGSIGNPWQTIQHALDNITRDSTNGDRINIKAGTDDTISSVLDFSTYGTPSVDAPLIFQGYTSSAGDGGIGGISGGGTTSLMSGVSINDIVFRDMHLHNTGSNSVIDRNIHRARFINCEIDNTTEHGYGSGQGTKMLFLKCHFHDIGKSAIFFDDGAIRYCYFKDDGSNTINNCVFQNSTLGIGPIDFSYNIVSLDGGGNGIVYHNPYPTVYHNSFLQSSVSPSGNAITDNASSSVSTHHSIRNNLIEGWDTGIYVDPTSDISTFVIHYNATYDCTTDYDLGDVIVTDDNEILGSTPFAKSGSDTYANRATYFAPQNVGNVYSPHGLVFKAKGAVQL